MLLQMWINSVCYNGKSYEHETGLKQYCRLTVDMFSLKKKQKNIAMELEANSEISN
jgi:hypothetical protein